ncbi:hypothetical protein ASPCADRAFT_202512, partial [Aspergillus carbonarius ITEM 5010]
RAKAVQASRLFHSGTQDAGRYQGIRTARLWTLGRQHMLCRALGLEPQTSSGLLDYLPGMLETSSLATIT